MCKKNPYVDYTERPQIAKEEASMKIGSHEVKILSNTEAVVGCQRVTVKDVQKLFDLMSDYKPPKPKFEVGDFVRVIDDATLWPTLHGVCGKIVVIDELDRGVAYGVEFAAPQRMLHSMIVDGLPTTKDHHGYWIGEKHLESVK